MSGLLRYGTVCILTDSLLTVGFGIEIEIHYSPRYNTHTFRIRKFWAKTFMVSLLLLRKTYTRMYLCWNLCNFDDGKLLLHCHPLSDGESEYHCDSSTVWDHHS